MYEIAGNQQRFKKKIQNFTKTCYVKSNALMLLQLLETCKNLRYFTKIFAINRENINANFLIKNEDIIMLKYQIGQLKEKLD